MPSVRSQRRKGRRRGAVPKKEERAVALFQQLKSTNPNVRIGACNLISNLRLDDNSAYKFFSTPKHTPIAKLFSTLLSDPEPAVASACLSSLPASIVGPRTAGCFVINGLLAHLGMHVRKLRARFTEASYAPLATVFDVFAAVFAEAPSAMSIGANVEEAKTAVEFALACLLGPGAVPPSPNAADLLGVQVAAARAVAHFYSSPVGAANGRRLTEPEQAQVRAGGAGGTDCKGAIGHLLAGLLAAVLADAPRQLEAAVAAVLRGFDRAVAESVAAGEGDAFPILCSLLDFLVVFAEDKAAFDRGALLEFALAPSPRVVSGAQLRLVHTLKGTAASFALERFLSEDAAVPPEFMYRLVAAARAFAVEAGAQVFQSPLLDALLGCVASVVADESFAPEEGAELLAALMTRDGASARKNALTDLARAVSADLAREENKRILSTDATVAFLELGRVLLAPRVHALDEAAPIEQAAPDVAAVLAPFAEALALALVLSQAAPEQVVQACDVTLDLLACRRTAALFAACGFRARLQRFLSVVAEVFRAMGPEHRHLAPQVKRLVSALLTRSAEW